MKLFPNRTFLIGGESLVCLRCRQNQLHSKFCWLQCFLNYRCGIEIYLLHVFSLTGTVALMCFVTHGFFGIAMQLVCLHDAWKKKKTFFQFLHTFLSFDPKFMGPTGTLRFTIHVPFPRHLLHTKGVWDWPRRHMEENVLTNTNGDMSPTRMSEGL